mmetsp:Transcript_42655/g.141268  ORF Transcript_42655/g.141268 Transcript_42655/m.141268 type:complete len:204 (+) Transcript_42655:232-843(+)
MPNAFVASNIVLDPSLCQRRLEARCCRSVCCWLRVLRPIDAAHGSAQCGQSLDLEYRLAIKHDGRRVRAHCSRKANRLATSKAEAEHPNWEILRYTVLRCGPAQHRGQVCVDALLGCGQRKPDRLWHEVGGLTAKAVRRDAQAAQLVSEALCFVHNRAGESPELVKHEQHWQGPIRRHLWPRRKRQNLAVFFGRDLHIRQILE